MRCVLCCVVLCRDDLNRVCVVLCCVALLC